MTSVQRQTRLLVTIGLAALFACANQTIAQTSAESPSSTAGKTENATQPADGPLLLNANERAATEESIPLPTPEPAATSASSRAAQPDSAERSPNRKPDSAVAAGEAAPTSSEAIDDLPPPFAPSREPKPRPVEFQPELGVTLDGSVRGAVAVRAVEPRSPAARAGLRRGDVIWAINDQRVDSLEEAHSIVESMQPGDSLNINYSRDLNAQITLDDGAVESAGYEEDLPDVGYSDEPDRRNEPYREERYRDSSRFQSRAEDLPVPSYSETSRSRRAFYYPTEAADPRDRYESSQAPRRDDEDGTRRLLGRERESDDRPARRPLLRWRRN